MKKKIFIAASILSLLASCKNTKDDPAPEVPSFTKPKNIYVAHQANSSNGLSIAKGERKIQHYQHNRILNVQLFISA